ncbi:MAG TPA: hypothetical protein DEH78_30470 [Solibacterales bacterium]|nr:hypothetical protein [Bryobacterales bacterium]
MARGWESKSVEEQQSAREERAVHPRLTPEEMERKSKRESLSLDRTRLQRELQQACNARHRGMLEQALAHIEAEIEKLG